MATIIHISYVIVQVFYKSLQTNQNNKTELRLISTKEYKEIRNKIWYEIIYMGLNFLVQ